MNSCNLEYKRVKQNKRSLERCRSYWHVYVGVGWDLGFFVFIARLNWTGFAKDVADEEDQIPPPGLEVGRTYKVLPLSACSPSDYIVRPREIQGKYFSFVCELHELLTGENYHIRNSQFLEGFLLLLFKNYFVSFM